MFPSAEELVEQCGKFKLMDRVLTRLRERGHKVLIFSQMTRMLNSSSRSWSRETTAGRCAHRRQRAVAGAQGADGKFNSDPSYNVFLLSTRGVASAQPHRRGHGHHLRLGLEPASGYAGDGQVSPHRTD